MNIGQEQLCQIGGLIVLYFLLGCDNRRYPTSLPLKVVVVTTFEVVNVFDLLQVGEVVVRHFVRIVK